MTVAAVPNPQGLLVRYTQTASGWSVTSTLFKQLSIGLTAHSTVFHLKWEASWRQQSKNLFMPIVV